MHANRFEFGVLLRLLVPELYPEVRVVTEMFEDRWTGVRVHGTRVALFFEVEVEVEGEGEGGIILPDD